MSSDLEKQPEAGVLAEDTPRETVSVLMIDDDASYRHLCQRFLSKGNCINYEVIEVSDAATALSECQSHIFDCILIDYCLPDLSGTELINSLSNMLADEVPPMIILTADGGEDAAAEAIRAGAIDFMPKRAVSALSLSRAISNAVEKGRLKNAVALRSRELEAANEQLKSKNDEIQRFYHTVSHEVKTPLAATREFVAIVLDGIVGPVTAEQKEMLTHALDSCDQISSHFNDLVEITRLETKKITMKKKVGSLDNVVTRCVASVASALSAKNIVLNREIETPLPLVFIDSNRVIQVLSNLLGNAIKFTGQGGEITLSVTHDVAAGYIQIAVADTGCGIPEEKLPHVFERLYQVENSSDDLMGAGLGLGLTIAKDIVALHDGDIWADSIPGAGSTFTFQLPTADSTLHETEKLA